MALLGSVHLSEWVHVLLYYVHACLSVFEIIMLNCLNRFISSVYKVLLYVVVVSIGGKVVSTP